MDFTNKQALVTGGTSGIGLAVTQALIARGCRVVATGLLPSEIEAFPVDSTEARAVQLDVVDACAVEALVAELPTLDFLVNCAGMILRDGLEHQPIVYEPLGEIHTLVVDGESDEMITLFHVQGALIYVDDSVTDA